MSCQQEPDQSRETVPLKANHGLICVLNRSTLLDQSLLGQPLNFFQSHVGEYLKFNYKVHVLYYTNLKLLTYDTYFMEEKQK